MSRALPEWIGRTPDTPVPPRVKLRVLERHNHTCHLSGRPIRPGDKWECDHVQAIINGGENRESNLAPALKDKHRIKSNGDVAEKSLVARKKMANYGIKKAKRLIPSRPFDKRFHLHMSGTRTVREGMG